MSTKRLRKIIFWTVCWLVAATHAAKVLLIPRPVPNQVITFRILAHSLINLKGYDVFMILPFNYPYIASLTRSPIRLLTYPTEAGTGSFQSDEAFFEWMDKDVRDYYAADPHDYLQLCRDALSLKSLEESVNREQFDLAIIDGHPHFVCMYALLYRASLKHITYVDQNIEILLSPKAIPTCTAAGGQELSFIHRLRNFWNGMFGGSIFSESDLLLREYITEKEQLTTEQLLAQSSFWLLNSNTILSGPSLYVQNMAETGGLTTWPSEKLSEDLEKFLNRPVLTEGVVVVSVGSDFENIPTVINDKLLEAFYLMKHPIVWENRKVQEEDPRIRILDWIPQNDLLGHEKTVLFVTDGNTNAQFEALYHGVPMILVPLTPEQRCTADGIVNKGYAGIIDIKEMSSEEIAGNITSAITEGLYVQEMATASQIYRDNDNHPVKRAVFWIDHVMKHGCDHLQPSLQSSLYQYMMLDVVGFLFTVVFCVWNVVILCIIFYCKGKKKGENRSQSSTTRQNGTSKVNDKATKTTKKPEQKDK